MNLRKALFTLAAASALAGPAPAFAAVVTLQAGVGGQSANIIEDAMLVQESSNDNFGGRADLEIGIPGGGQVRTAVMRFGVTDPTLGLYIGGVPQFDAIQSVALTLTMTSQAINAATSDNQDIRIAANQDAQGDWVEGTGTAAASGGDAGNVTYSERREGQATGWVPDTNYTRGVGNGTLATILTWPGLNTAVTVNLTAPGINGLNTLEDLVNAWATGNNEGILINTLAISGNLRWFFHSSESATLAARPMLTITYSIPIPTPAALPAGLGLMGLAAIRGRRRRRRTA